MDIPVKEITRILDELNKLTLSPKVVGSRFRVQGSKVIVYFTRIQG